MSVSLVTDHAERAVALLTERYRQPSISALLRSWVNRVQELENAYFDLLTKRGVSNGVGTVLDLLGKIVGQPREGRLDDLYRVWIAARVLVNQSSGTHPQLIALVQKLVSFQHDVRLEDEYPAAFTMHVDVPIDGPTGVQIAKLLKVARAGGIGGLFHWHRSATTFRFSAIADTPALGSAFGFGAGELSAVSDGRDMGFIDPPAPAGPTSALPVIL